MYLSVFECILSLIFLLTKSFPNYHYLHRLIVCFLKRNNIKLFRTTSRSLNLLSIFRVQCIVIHTRENYFKYKSKTWTKNHFSQVFQNLMISISCPLEIFFQIGNKNLQILSNLKFYCWELQCQT